MRIFNRERDKTHSLFSILEEMHNQKDPAKRALACNLSHESRISEDREREFLRLLGHCDSLATFNDRWNDYIDTRVRALKGDDPEFRNAHNNCNEAPDPQDKLVCLFSINGLSRMFLWTKLNATLFPDDMVRVFEAYPSKDDQFDTEVINFVNTFMQNPATRSIFVQIIFSVYEQYRIDHPYQPMWLTTWSNFAPIYSIKDADRWCHLVGVSTAGKKGMWIIVLVYQPANLEQLYRPSVLDGASRFFFPTPENGDVASGLAADLKMTADKPACEYISLHPSLESAEVDLETGCAQLQETVEAQLYDIRKYHIIQLRNGFKSEEAIAWIERVDNDW